MTARIPLAVCLASLVASAAMLMLPAPAGLEPGVMRGAGAVTLGVGLWATRVIPEHLGSIIFFLVAVLFAVAPRRSSSSASSRARCGSSSGVS